MFAHICSTLFKVSVIVILASRACFRHLVRPLYLLASLSLFPPVHSSLSGSLCGVFSQRAAHNELLLLYYHNRSVPEPLPFGVSPTSHPTLPFPLVLPLPLVILRFEGNPLLVSASATAIPN